MKKLVFTVMVSLSMLGGLIAQGVAAADEIYRRYASQDDVLAMGLSYDLIDVLDLDLEVGAQLKHISGDISHLKVMIFGEKAQAEQSLEDINRRLAAAGLEALNPPRELIEDEEFRLLQVYGHREAKHFSHIYLLMLSDDGTSGAYLAVEGKIKIRQAS